MERKEEDDPMAEIKAIQQSEETKEENIDYIEVSFQGWDIYIWGCQKFTPFLTNDGGSVAKRIAAQAEDYLEGKKEKANLSTRKKSNRWKDQGPHRSTGLYE